jgi:hypothetical protein
MPAPLLLVLDLHAGACCPVSNDRRPQPANASLILGQCWSRLGVDRRRTLLGHCSSVIGRSLIMYLPSTLAVAPVLRDSILQPEDRRGDVTTGGEKGTYPPGAGLVTRL